jgi:MFS family permease
MVSIVLWPFLTLPEKHILTMPLLVAIHVLAGMSTAGVTLCAGNVALKAAPKGQATAFLAANALISGLAATAAPVIAGLGADWFAGQNLRLSIEWLSAITGETRFHLPAVDLKGLDFLFVISFVFGLYAVHRLLAVREEGEVEEKVVVTHLYGEVRKAVRHVSNVAGLRHLTYFPYERLRRASGGTSAAQADAPQPSES